jgi:hypothetical protein
VANSTKPGVFDLFISYKHQDSSEFVEALVAELKKRGFDIWVDSDQMHPGDSILQSIENGLNDSIDAMVVLSPHYFEGWSEQERRAIFNLMVSKRVRILPVWFQLDHKTIQRQAPMFADIVGIPASDASAAQIKAVSDKVQESYNPTQRRSRLFEMFFRSVAEKFPEDQDLALWIALLASDTESLKSALEHGADPNLTDGALWNRYASNSEVVHDCFPQWRKLYLYLNSIGAIGSKSSSQEK